MCTPLILFNSSAADPNVRSVLVLDEKGLLIAESSPSLSKLDESSDAAQYISRIVSDANSLFPNSPVPVISIISENKSVIFHGKGKEDSQTVCIIK
jgi:hypothetical protein